MGDSRDIGRLACSRLITLTSPLSMQGQQIQLPLVLLVLQYSQDESLAAPVVTQGLLVQ